MDYHQCPFCKELDFDLIGLKLHLMGRCEAYFNTPTSDKKLEVDAEEMKVPSVQPG